MAWQHTRWLPPRTPCNLPACVPAPPPPHQTALPQRVTGSSIDVSRGAACWIEWQQILVTLFPENVCAPVYLFALLPLHPGSQMSQCGMRSTRPAGQCCTRSANGAWQTPGFGHPRWGRAAGQACMPRHHSTEVSAGRQLVDVPIVICHFPCAGWQLIPHY